MTRTANKQRKVMERILKVWQKYPELRLGQFLSNVRPLYSLDIYYTTDEDLVMLAESYNPES